MNSSSFKIAKPRLRLKVIALFLVFFCLAASPQNALALEILITLKPGHAEPGKVKVKQTYYRSGTVDKSVYSPIKVNKFVYHPATIHQSVHGQKPPAVKKTPVKGPPQINPKDPVVIKTMQLARSVRKRMAYRVSRGGRYRSINYAKSPNIDTSKYRTVRVKATAYSPKDKGVGKYTFSEVKVQPNVIAVDPKVIPLGSLVYVPGYGLAVAADIGSGVKGYHIDLFMESRKKALTWGKKYIEIYIYR